MSDFPKQLLQFRAYREDGSCIYSGAVESLEGLEFYRDGHEFVYSLEVAKYTLSETRALEVDRRPSRLKTWGERNNR